jgi:hypothetical protein
MKIDYSIKPSSKYFLFIDVPFRQGLNHIGLAVSGNNYGLSLAERIKHIILGILKFIPLLGHEIALVDTLCQRKSIVHLKLTSKDPFKRGEEHGQALKNRIKEVFDPILNMKGSNSTLLGRSIQFEKQIPNDLKKEMEGLAKGSGYSYEDVVLIHTFLDAQPGQFGCTSMVIKETNEKCQRLAAANHLLESTYNTESESRRQAFLKQPIPKNGSINEVLKAAGKDETIQAMMFDTVKGEIRLSSKGTYAASGKFKTLGPSSIFNSHKFSNIDSNNRVRLFRNLDWPWYFLGQETVVLTRPHSNGNSTVSISWPGYIGTLSGINNNGLALTQNQCGFGINLNGIPNPLLFTNILDTCKDVEEANQVIEKRLHGSAMNLVIADKISAKSYELKGNGDLSCVQEIN